MVDFTAHNCTYATLLQHVSACGYISEGLSCNLKCHCNFKYKTWHFHSGSGRQGYVSPVVTVINMLYYTYQLCEIWSSHSGHCKHTCPFGSHATQLGTQKPTFQRNVFTSSSGETTPHYTWMQHVPLKCCYTTTYITSYLCQSCHH